MQFGMVGSRPYGREHDAAIDARRTSTCRLRSQRGCGERLSRRRGRSIVIVCKIWLAS